MSLVTTDRIKETCNVVGLNDVTLTGTLTGYKSFSSVMNVGDTCYYSIVDSFDGKWEVGIGTLSNSVTLQRTTVNTIIRWCSLQMLLRLSGYHLQLVN